MTRRAYRRSGQQGVAMVEAVIMLPFFILIFFGIHYWGGLEIKRNEAKQRARACAWEFSNTGCDDDDLPQACMPESGLTFSNEAPPGKGGAEADGPTPSEQVASSTQTAMTDKKEGLKDDGGAIMGWVTDNLMDALTALTGKKLTKTATIAMATPKFLPEPAEPLARGGYRLTCNVRPKTIPQFFDDIWKKVSPF